MFRSARAVVSRTLAAAAFSLGAAHASAVVFPTAAHVADNTIPTGVTCVHHQVFDASLFSTATGGQPALITRIALAPGTNARYSANIIVRLGYTSAFPGGLSPPPTNVGGGGAPNADGPMTDFFVAPNYLKTFTGASPNNFQLAFDGTPFVYDPTLGNLLVEFVIASPNHDGINVSRTTGTPEASRAYNLTGTTGTAQATIALRMDFTFSAHNPSNSGACCMPDGSCSFVTLADCQSAGGKYAGDNIACGAGACPQPGACCMADGSCAQLQDPACVAGGGVWNGAGTACGGVSCAQPGACFAVANACDVRQEDACTALGSAWREGDCDTAVRPGVLVSPAGVCTFPVICNSSAAPTAVDASLYIDLTASGGADLSVSRIDYNASAITVGTPTTVTIWVRDGSYVGFDNTLDGWANWGTLNAASNGSSLVHPPVHLNLPTPIIIPRGETRGVCLVANTGGLRYRTTAASVGDSRLTLFSNVSRTPAFTGASVTRGFYGAVVYDVFCSADFDGDGDTGTDSDIEAFFACLGGNCCPTCGSADFDQDGDTGTDADIEAFFRVLGGGAC